MRAWRRTSVALAVSLAVHLLVVLGLSRSERPVPTPAAERPPIVVEIRRLRQPASPRERVGVAKPDATRRQAPTAQRPVAPSGAHPHAAADPSRSPAIHDAAEPASESARLGAGLPRSAPPDSDEPPASTEGVAAAEETRRRSLFPTIPGVAGHGGPWVRTDSGRGRTIRNDPSERPDPEALAAYDAERAKAKVDGWLADELAAHLVEVGLVDGYFQQLRHGLEQQAAPPPPFEGGPFVKQLLKEYVASAQRFGQSGNPYVEAPAVGRPDEVLSPTERFAEADRDRGPGKVNGTQTAASPVEDFRRTLRMGASLRDFADGKMSGALVAVVEIRQSAGGQLLGHLLVESSGNKLFDTHVMSTAPEAVAKLPPPPATGSGIHPEGLRSLWAFEGKVIYRKKLKDVKWDESWWYHAAMLPAGLVTGNFDEMTGDVYVVDLTDPQFVCNVRLLRVY